MPLDSRRHNRTHTCTHNHNSYQYLSLVHFLETGSWDEGEGDQEEPAGKKEEANASDGGKQQEERRSITFRDGWGPSWNSFYQLAAESLGGHEVRFSVWSV
jgi:hypothetical protein